jgi:hypothetical protein
MLVPTMKTLAILVSLAFAAPVFACPHEEGEAKTAEKAKDTKGTKAKEAPKKDDATTAKKKEEATPDTAKKPDKVSQK